MADTETDPTGDARASRRGMSIFRGGDAPNLFESGTMSTPVWDAGDQAVVRADGPRNPDVLIGGRDSVLYRGDGPDGWSMVRVWFGPHYVLPRHSHDSDCLYYVAEGSLTMGAQVLEPGDGFFLPAGAPYGYEAGPDGVVVIEFRTRTSFGMDIPGGQVERLRRAQAAADEHGDTWRALRAAGRD